MKTNYHMHTFYCGHASGTVRENVIEAISLGMEVIGFSEHAPIPLFSDRMSMDMFESYLQDIDDARKEFGSQIQIYKGLEIEYIDSELPLLHKLRSQVDYMILGAHFYTDLGDVRENSTLKVKTKEQLKIHGDYMEKAMESGLFSMVAHPDYFMMSYPVWDEECCKFANRLCDAALKMKIPLEVNSNGFRRKLRKREDGEFRPYALESFFNIVKERGVPVLVSADSHSPKGLDDEAVLEACSFASSLNLTIHKYLDFK